MIKIFLIISLFSYSGSPMARVIRKKVSRGHKKSVKAQTTAVSICSRDTFPSSGNLVSDKRFTQAVIVALENISESKCRNIGAKRAAQYGREGWKCTGLNEEEIFSCVRENSAFFATYKGNHLDHLRFTDLHIHRALIGYLNPNSFSTCLEDKKDLEAGGVTDAKCYKRKN